MSGRELPRDLGFPGRVAVSWSMASGVLAGGASLAVLTMTGRLSAFGLAQTSTLYFAAGALFGFLHGGVLGWMGRGPETSAESGLRSVGLAGMFVLPGLAVSWVAASLIAHTMTARLTGNVLALAGVGVAWIAGVWICLWAAREGGRAFGHALRGWEDPLVGSTLVALTFGSLLALFWTERPELWGTQLRVGPIGALLLAGFATTWISGPAISLPLWLNRRLPEPRIVARVIPKNGALVVSVVLSAVAGAVLAGLAIWLAPSAATAPAIDVGLDPATLLLLTGSHAVIDEVLFRLFALTTVVWLFRRWHPLHPEEATVAGVLFAAVFELLVYLPAYLAQGLGSAGDLMMQMVWLTAFPALALGGLFVWRGLPAAIVAATVFRFLLGSFAG